MKKTIFLCLMAMSFCLGGFAQKGRQAVGIDVPFRFNDYFNDHSFGIGLKYQYNINDYVRIEPIAQWYFVHEGIDNYKFIGAFNGNFFFNAPNRFRAYGIVGLGYSVYEEGDDVNGGMYDAGIDCKGFYLQCGLGIDYRLNYD